MKFTLKNISPFVAFLALALLVHFFLPLNWGDDKIFGAEASLSLGDFLYGSSRIMTDTMTYIFSKYHILWRIINPFVLTLLPYVISKLLGATDKKIQAVICGLSVFPAMVTVDAGFIATTVNYLWPVAFGLFSLLIFQNIAAGKKVPWYILLSGIAALLYAINMEQMSAVLTASFAIGCFYLFFVKKRFNVYPLALLLVSSFGLVYAYIGNTSQDNSRMMRETARYFPDFSSLGLFEKLELGFSSTMYCFTMDVRFAFAAFIAFTVFLAVVLFKKSNKLCDRAAALFPAASAVVLAVFNLISPFENLKHYRMTKAVYHFSAAADIYFIVVLVCVMYTLAVILKEKHLVIKAFTVLAAGFASRVVMGFSPTVWASGYRTFFIMFISFIVVAIIIMERERTACEGRLVNQK